MFEWLASPEAWIALGTLTALEIVLGIDNIIFISILVGRLSPESARFRKKNGSGSRHVCAPGFVVLHFLGDGTDATVVHRGESRNFGA